MGILEGRGAVVTGSGRGIGRGHCLHLAEQGAGVIVNDVDEAAAKEVVEEIVKAGGKAEADTSDISTRGGAAGLVEHCVNAFGNIQCVVNNAGNVRDKSFLKMTDDDFMSVLKVHQFGTFAVSQEGAQRMRDQGTGGVIVNTVSAAHFGNFGQTNYAGSKGAIASMTYTWALELARYGIRVNAISPTGTTRMSDTYKGPDGKDVKLPFIDPTRNGAFIAYLASDHAKWISGQIFGTGGERVVMLKQPTYGTGIYKDGGWSVDDLVEKFEQMMKKEMEPVGLMKTPYPFYDGVEPKAK